MSVVGQRIKALREKENWSQVHLAERLGINNSVLSRIESGEKKHVEDYLISKAADVFDVSTDYLHGRTNDPSPALKKNSTNLGLAFIDGGAEELDEEEMDYLKESLELFRRMKERKAKEREGK
ncbi:helix-turn-helix domain-containing protein [Brevibacillus centrosporus]|uniref:helix-turn-helix domain-containing protein n=1 Tax=Brevibacillus centrosporus TaxID=54910 RepID=UPI002E24BB38|nr:helix-turn-helix domain-containing protein [Brevibacillus centrosporus]